jgi:hypothetical protein
MRYLLLTCALMISASTFGGPKAIDTDGDRMISLAEAQQGAPALASRFNELDANKDGLLSIDEVTADQRMHSVRIVRDLQEDFTAADRNADGMLTKTEAAEMPIVDEFFGEMDANADGFVTKEEIQAHAKTHGPIRVIKRRMVATPEQ